MYLCTIITWINIQNLKHNYQPPCFWSSIPPFEKILDPSLDMYLIHIRIANMWITSIYSNGPCPMFAHLDLRWIKVAALRRLPWRLHMSEKLSSGTINIQTINQCSSNTLVIYASILWMMLFRCLLFTIILISS